MTVKTRQRYRIECDIEWCQVRVPDATDEIDSFSSRNAAEWAARNRGWLITWKGEDLCPDHRDVLR